MTEGAVEIRMNEWETRLPQPGSGLEGRALAGPADRLIASELAKAELLEITELRAGLSIRSFSHVGKIRLGDIEITVLPKLKQTSLLNLLRYAYGFRKLRLISETPQQLVESGFADLLVRQLLAEAEELFARGLHRNYVPRKEWLSTPKGRLDIQRLSARGGVFTASLPCTHHPRINDTLLNRVLLAGLRLAGTVASDLQLRRESKRRAFLLAEYVAAIRLDASALEQANRQMSRLTVAYEPALTLTRLLWESRSEERRVGKERGSASTTVHDGT